ncbi:hypothetical protein SAMN05421803_101358 [Nocardiopsis flavescens]|uniref:Uncharacterized protein n=1 Tax=Nocardiopsis flavescens TaxID=758803 RepID=A0A1M6BHX6_9ACTN|nr:hypothetical protein SAMN05421803_101358 [Nocardiopsis flavescens]
MYDAALEPGAAGPARGIRTGGPITGRTATAAVVREKCRATAPRPGIREQEEKVPHPSEKGFAMSSPGNRKSRKPCAAGDVTVGTGSSTYRIRAAEKRL